jgi:hypothetical protein
VHTKKHLHFTALRKKLSALFCKIPDQRQTGKIDYSLHDCIMSALAMMFFQDPSLLSFQRRVQDAMQCNNLKTMFAVGSIPKDTPLREAIDDLPSELLAPAFDLLFHQLQRAKQLEPYRLLDSYLIGLDGSQYFSSEKIHCPGCLTFQSKGKTATRYAHQILQAVMLHPNMRQVLPLFPEAVTNSDGNEKQDCEINAAKRLLPKLRAAHPKLPIIITADGLYSKQPFIDALKAARMSFILVAKPTDHKVLFQWVEDLDKLNQAGHMKLIDDKGRHHLYRWVNQVPLNDTRDADAVNFFEYWLRVGEKVTYHNSWVTDLTVDRNNVVDLVKGGRARWKIENETFNTLKNQGYHVEHNFGHGTQNLSVNFFVLNLLAFFIHQILELCDDGYQYCRSKFSSRMEYWNNLRAAIRIMLFGDYEHLLRNVADPPEIRAP